MSILALAALAGAFAPIAPTSPPVAAQCTAPPVGQDGFCTTSDGTRIHFVDWGGRGPAIILLAGLGASARTFDDFAPRLAHGHRVIAITRRGYGLSGDAATDDYSNARLTKDIVEVMGGLRIARASFVGHSLAGGELASLGVDYPTRVDRLVYLDAAYDRSPVPLLMKDVPSLPPPGRADLADIDALTRWREGALRVRSPAVRADLEDVMRQSATGLVPRTAPVTAGKILTGDIAAPPRYAAIAAPSLALYGSKDVPEQVPTSATPAQSKAFVKYSIDAFRPWMLREKARFEADQRCGTAYEVPNSSHNLYLERPEWTAKVVLRFIEAAKPCRFVVR